MPYASNDELPAAVRARLSDRCQSVYREVWNEAYADSEDEGQAFRIAATAANRCMSELSKMVTLTAPIAKRDGRRQIAYGVVLEPRTADNPDAQGDWYTSEDVEQAAHYFMAEVTKGNGYSDVMHDGGTRAGYPVESYIAPTDLILGDEVIKQGSWVIGMHYPDKALWQRIEEGEFAAFSVGGSGVREG